MARVLDAGPRRRAISFGLRYLLHSAGVTMIAFAVAMMLWNDLGPGPLDVFIGAVRQITGLPLSFAVYATTGSMILIAWALGRRPGIGNLSTPLLLGPLLQIFLSALSGMPSPDSFAVKLPIQLIAIAIVAIGAGAMISSDIGSGTAELLTAAASDQTGVSQPKVRTAMELSWLIGGVLLGGPAGVGTIIVAATIGPAVSLGYRFVDSLVARATVPVERMLPSV